MANENKPNRQPDRNSGTAVKPDARPNANQPLNQGLPSRRLTPRQEAARKRAQQRQRTQLIFTGVGVLLLAAIVIAIVVVASQPTDFKGLPAASTDTTRFSYGPADAKVSVEEYGDYQCPACKSWHDANQQKLIDDYIKTNKSVKFTFHFFPFLDNGHPDQESHLLVQGAYCAADQKRFWNYHDAVYNNQPLGENTGFWTPGRVKELGQKLGLNSGDFNSCVDSNRYKAQAGTDAQAAEQRGVTGTPTFYVNGQQINLTATTDYDSVKTAIDQALSGNGATTAAGTASATPTTPNK